MSAWTVRRETFSSRPSYSFITWPSCRMCTEAVRDLSLEAEVSRLEEQGIVHAIRGQKDLEEAAGAYKDIDEVMANQSDLVKIVTALSPVAVIKG